MEKGRCRGRRQIGNIAWGAARRYKIFSKFTIFHVKLYIWSMAWHLPYANKRNRILLNTPQTNDILRHSKNVRWQRAHTNDDRAAGEREKKNEKKIYNVRKTIERFRTGHTHSSSNAHTHTHNRMNHIHICYTATHRTTYIGNPTPRSYYTYIVWVRYARLNFWNTLRALDFLSH